VRAGSGALSLPAFLVDGSPLADTRPEVSSKTDFVAGVDRWMVVWQRAIPGGPITFAHDDIWGAIYDGTGAPLTGSVDLTALLNRPIVDNQWNPCVDTDGTRFAVGFSEDPSIFTPDVIPFLATVHLTPTMTIGVSSYAESLNGSTQADDHVRVTAEHSGGTYTSRYMAVWDVTNSISGLQTTLGAFYRGHTHLPPSSYYNIVPIGCGPMTILPYGLPAIGETMVIDLVGAVGIPVLVLGPPVAPLPMCAGCSLGIDPGALSLIVSPSWVLTVPQNIGLLGFQFGAQGLDLFAPGGCPSSVIGFDFTLTDEVIVTIL
jgi:hypothetical protein